MRVNAFSYTWQSRVLPANYLFFGGKTNKQTDAWTDKRAQRQTYIEGQTYMIKEEKMKKRSVSIKEHKCSPN